uniref:Structural maintenance of chromosomes protein 2 n=1 Tax=Ascaris lumbricoides TaxID=6252 RepID=A0A0M3IHY8_ASCLU
MRIKKIEIDGFKSYAQRQVVDGFDAQFNAITGLNGSGKSNILDAICFVLGITNLNQMRIKKIEIDGFKSYAQRQVVDGFDAQFNAITGLNGSGKSNILDAICFVLGITNLNQVRAVQLSDLVYKQGQAGVTKATVTITFDNTDPKTRPIGYEQYNEIVVRRQIEIDGFKSYAQRQVVDGFDAQFNAITGLNGSGKSNILDAICFVLGITNLNQVRAVQLSDLVYKQGQAGVTKATVTITFDNTDPKTRPIGYEQYNEIVVRRQIVINGRNTYTINGTAATNTRVADMFKSVGLNVNNPHFLIMQGRITKVLNMKSTELLNEDIIPCVEKLRRDRNDYLEFLKINREIEVMERKLVAFDYVSNQLLNEDIIPCVEKLRRDRNDYLEFQKINREIEVMERKLVAFDYVSNQTLLSAQVLASLPRP